MVTKAGAIKQRFAAIKDVQHDLVGSFNDATMYPEDNINTLFGAMVTKEQMKVKVHSRKTVLSKKPSQTKLLHKYERKSAFVQKGKMLSSQHLLAVAEAENAPRKLKMKASELYIPKSKRKMETKLSGFPTVPKEK